MASPIIKKEEEKTKWEVIYEDDESISIWKYDKTKTTNGPVSVEQKWKRGFEPWGGTKKKTIKDLIAEEKKTKKKGT
jgi:hypothetical protein